MRLSRIIAVVGLALSCKRVPSEPGVSDAQLANALAGSNDAYAKESAQLVVAALAQTRKQLNDKPRWIAELADCADADSPWESRGRGEHARALRGGARPRWQSRWGDDDGLLSLGPGACDAK